VDVLVEIKNDMSLFDFVGMKLELEEAINSKVERCPYP
jgi:predicted nucleotidyltransferase